MIIVKRICIFYLLAKVLLHFCPSKKYESYMSAIAEWCVVLLFLFPLLSKNNIEALQNAWQTKVESLWDEKVNQQISQPDEGKILFSDEAIEKMLRDEAEKQKEGGRKSERENR